MVSTLEVNADSLTFGSNPLSSALVLAVSIEGSWKVHNEAPGLFLSASKMG